MGMITPNSAIQLLQKVRVNSDKWNRIPSNDIVTSTIEHIKQRGITVIHVDSAEEALTTIRNLIPSGATVMNGSSTTLIEIGYEQLIGSGDVNWIDLHEVINHENDSVRRNELRRKSVASDYFLSSVNAIAQSGELVSCDRTGSRVGAWPFAAGHLILVSGINKIVPTLDDALQRIREYVYPLENERSQRVYGTGSRIGKCVILAYEEIPGRIFLILVNESLGY